MGLGRRVIMKAILMSIKPEWVAKILNGEKTIEIRKRFPKDYKGWVYIYCTYGTPKQSVMYWNKENGKYVGNHCCLEHCLKIDGIKTTNKNWSALCDSNEWEMNGKVVARFWCDNVEECPFDYSMFPYEELCDGACLTQEEIEDYAFTKNGYQTLYGIHISKLEVFDRPKELSEFHKVGYEKLNNNLWNSCCTDRNTFERLDENYQITKAPQSWQFIEVEQ